MNAQPKYTKVCPQCGKKFAPQRQFLSELKHRKYCSPECRQLSQGNQVSDLLKRTRHVPSTGCYLWTGPTVGKGYGRSRMRGRKVLVHKAIWEEKYGPVPEGKQLDHACGFKACCNIQHLRLSSARDNCLAANSKSMGAVNFRKVVCPKCGGPYSTIYDSTTDRWNRYCRPCRHEQAMEAQRIRRAKKKKQ